MKSLIRASLDNPHAIIVMALAIAVLGSLSLLSIPIDILPVFKNRGRSSAPALSATTFMATKIPAER